jgi:hypothetical protein
MNLRTLILIAVTTAAFGAAAPPATTAAMQRCGTHKVEFKNGFLTVRATWRISATGVSCGDAVKVVRKLAGKPLPNYRRPYPGTYAGLRCTGGPEGASWARSLTCKQAGSAKTITATAL